MAQYTVICPFCDREQNVTESEYNYTSTGCSCGARFNCNNYEKEVSCITNLPRTAYRIQIGAEEEFDCSEYDSIEEATNELIQNIQDAPRETLNSPQQFNAVTEEQIATVLEKGLHGDGVNISSADITKGEIREFGVEPPN